MYKNQRQKKKKTHTHNTLECGVVKEKLHGDRDSRLKKMTIFHSIFYYLIIVINDYCA